jgi:thiamine pyrophosphokinase
MSPSPSKSFTIFLNGEYPPDEDSFYRNLIMDTDCSIAVDGGQVIFDRLSLTPDIILADFDSSAPPKPDSGIEIVAFDSDKDQTDGELALGLALDRGAEKIALCGYRGGPATDQILANLLLLQKAADSSPPAQAYCLSKFERVWFVRDRTVQLKGEIGENMSVVALDEQIRLSAEGVRYAVRDKIILRGETRALSNSFQTPVCHITISGSALIFQRRKISPSSQTSSANSDLTLPPKNLC